MESGIKSYQDLYELFSYRRDWAAVLRQPCLTLALSGPTAGPEPDSGFWQLLEEHPKYISLLVAWHVAAGLQPQAMAKLQINSTKECNELFKVSKEVADALKRTVRPDNEFLVRRLGAYAGIIDPNQPPAKPTNALEAWVLDEISTGQPSYGASLLLLFDQRVRKHLSLQPVEQYLPPQYQTAYKALLQTKGHLKKS